MSYDAGGAEWAVGGEGRLEDARHSQIFLKRMHQLSRNGSIHVIGLVFRDCLEITQRFPRCASVPKELYTVRCSYRQAPK